MGFEATLPRITASVNLACVRHNLSQVRCHAPRSRIMATVKADAYGHGAVPVARALQNAGAESLAVACLEEALSLRDAGITLPLVLLEGVLSVDEAAAAVAAQLQIVVHSAWQIELLRSLSRELPVHLWFKLDSGMHRLGFPAHEATELWAIATHHPQWKCYGWMTHLACADQVGNPMTRRQVELFEDALRGIPGDRSIGNSAGLIAWPAAKSDWVRPGLMLYGASPFPDRNASELGLQPAMRLSSRVIATHMLSEGETIGYGATWCSQRPTRIGVIAAGYADGICRSLPTGTPILIHGLRVPVVGCISMDMITVDLHDAPQARVGDEVVFWGDGLAVEEIASRAGTIAYELFCSLNHRVKYRYCDD